MDCSEVLSAAKRELMALDSHLIDILEIKKPPSLAYAKSFAKVVSKLSPLLGNMIEFSTVDLLNGRDWGGEGIWIRQDPGFPDALFRSGTVLPNPGIEIKTWFPFATEMTARFKDSVEILRDGNIDMALIAWLPENVIWGRPQIIDVLVVGGKSVAEARDSHYYRPPDYLVFEPEDTSERAANLRQTNTNGYKLQQDKCSLEDAVAVVETWGADGRRYSSTPERQRLLRTLYGRFVYRLDTNYAKIDRIGHADIENFKTRVLNMVFHGRTIKRWGAILASKDEDVLDGALRTVL